MPADSKHNSYKKFEKEWRLLDDLCEGERRIKEQGVLYLPMLEGQNAKQYHSYKMRGTLYNATDRTIGGMCGCIMRKEPEFFVPDKLKNILGSIMVDGRSAIELVRDCVQNILKTGRYGLLIDMSETQSTDNVPFIATYEASNIINWRTAKWGDTELITFLVLQENIDVISEEDAFESEQEQQIRVLQLIGDSDLLEEEQTFENCILEIQLYRKVKGEWMPHGEPINPIIAGKKFNRIPFVCLGSLKNGMDVSKPPLIDLANINIAHWRQTVDHAHGLHYTALPTPWAAGFQVDKSSGKLHIGSQTAWISSDPSANCGYLEFSGAGLSAIVVDLDKKEKQMASLGANLIERQRSGVEAAETARIRQTTETVSLSTIVDCIASGIEKAFGFCCLFMNITAVEKIKAQINKDFIEYRMSAEMLKAMTAALQAGGISSTTFTYNVKMGELLPPGTTVEQELDLIATDGINDFESNDIQNDDIEIQ